MTFSKPCLPVLASPWLLYPYIYTLLKWLAASILPSISNLALWLLLWVWLFSLGKLMKKARLQINVISP